MNHKIAQLSISPSKKSATNSEIFVSQPDSVKEALAGKLFILIEINSNKTENLKIINYLIDIINHNYYQNEKILLREKISSLKVEHIFEAALAKTNKSFKSFIESEKFKINFNTINITVGIIHENSLHFATCGLNKVFLIYKNKDNNNYKILDIAKKAEVEKRQEKNINLFNNVISGKIPEQGSFLISNEALPEYISNNQLIEIVTTLPPVGAVEQIKNNLARINSFIAFNGIIIKSTIIETQVVGKSRPTVSAQDSIIDLNKTEDDTEELLAQKGIINAKKWLKFPSSFSFNKKSSSSDNKNNTLQLKDKILVKRKSNNIIKKAITVIKNIAIYLINAIFFVFKLISNKNLFSNILSKIKNIFTNNIDKISNGYTSLNKKNKTLLFIASIFILLFIFNLSTIKLKNDSEEKKKEYDDIALLIEQKQNQAEANLLYSNEEGAQKLFEEIGTLIENIPRDNEEQIGKYEEAKKKLELQMEKIRRVERLDTEEIANFVNLNSQAEPQNIILNHNKIYSSDSAQKSIYVLNTDDKLVTTITDLKLPLVSFNSPAINDEGVVYYIDNPNVIAFNSLDQSMKNISINYEYNDIKAASTYNNKLYLLDTENNKILRYNRNGNSFSPAYSWLSESANLKNAVDMSIDGHVYVLNNDGEILKFLRGIRQDFNLEAVDPQLENPTNFFVSFEKKYIYILEPSKQRLIIFDKTGQFILQYKSDTFTDLKDFAVDENKKQIYLLNGASILKLETTHLEKES